MKIFNYFKIIFGLTIFRRWRTVHGAEETPSPSGFAMVLQKAPSNSCSNKNQNKKCNSLLSNKNIKNKNLLAASKINEDKRGEDGEDSGKQGNEVGNCRNDILSMSSSSTPASSKSSPTSSSSSASSSSSLSASTPSKQKKYQTTSTTKALVGLCSLRYTYMDFIFIISLPFTVTSTFMNWELFLFVLYFCIVIN